MSGDVQPRKRKDKKRKKDELGVEEPRGTAAVLGEGDVFMHSHHEHGTGGHWCAKVIFFSLLAVLVTLIGLIILENRGLTELEANSVESRYSGVLEGWLEDAPDDDHHDEHTLELLKHHDDEDDDHDEEHGVSQEDDHDDDDHEDSGHDDDDDSHDEVDQDNDERGDNEDDDDDQEASIEQPEDDDDDDQEADDDDDQEADDDENSEEQQAEADEDDDENESGENNEEDDDDLQTVDENDTNEDDDDNDDQSVENDDDDSNNNDDEDEENDDEEHEEQEEEDGDDEIEVEKLEKEVTDEALSEEQPTQEEDDDEDNSQEASTELPPEDDADSNEDDADSVEDEEFLEADDVDEPLPVVERIVTPKGKPFVEVEDEPTTAKPADTLADEEEYEKQQEELRKEEAEASHVWLKLVVGGALLVATHAVVSRAVAPRDDTPASEGHASREESPSTIDRRMTLIPEETAAPARSQEIVEEVVRPIIQEKVIERSSPIVKSFAPPPKEEIEDEEVEEEEELIIKPKAVTVVETPVDLETEDKELYSDEEKLEEEEEDILEEKVESPVVAPPVEEEVVEPEPEEPEADEDLPDDVEIIDDEQIEEELEEEEDDEEEISDVDDAELLSRLEAKYGRLPEPERPGQKPKDGGNSIEDDWPGEPSDKYWRQQIDEAEQELRQGDWSAAIERVSAEYLKGSVRARWVLARAIDASAEAKRDNRLLTRAITAYLDVLKLNQRLSDARLREIADRTLDRIRFRGNYMSAEPVYRLLIRRFPDVATYRNNLTISFLMANRADLAEEVIKETIQKWPDDRVALAHLGFILKTKHNRLEEAVVAFSKALVGDVGPATEPRFYYHYGDSLLLLGRFAEAHEVHKRGAKLGHFLSPAQRSLYNVERLKSKPWWNIEQTPYIKLARALEKSWKEILKEGLAAQTLYEKEKEGLKERGEWSQLDLFVRGQEVPGRCQEAPVTCKIVRSEVAAAGCRRGQIKFSSMDAGTHVRPHVGPTNCRLRMHLGLSNTKDTYIRVDQETRQWQVGKVFMFDDSFEHEVWHNGTGTRLVLIVDVWHPDLTPAERRSLPPI